MNEGPQGSRQPPLMMRELRAVAGVLAALFALLMFGLSFLAASSTHHTLRPHEREHLEAAVQFVRERQSRTGVIPEKAEFKAWAQAMDLKGFRFEGNGFTLDKGCGQASEFCVYFSTGDGFVTYRSWESSMDRVTFDDSPLTWAFGFLVAGLLAGLLSKSLFARKWSGKTRTSGQEPG